MIIEFFIPCLPVAKGRPKFFRRGNFVGAYTPKKTRQAEDNFLTLAMKYKPAAPIDSPIELCLTFTMPRPASMSKSARAIINAPHIKRPDVDNLSKLSMDALNGIFWRDDSLIYRKTATKVYGDNPGVKVLIIVGDGEV